MKVKIIASSGIYLSPFPHREFICPFCTETTMISTANIEEFESCSHFLGLIDDVSNKVVFGSNDGRK